MTEQLKGTCHLVNLQTRPVTRDIRFAEDIAEQPLNPIKHATCSINRNRIAAAQGKGPQIIDTMDMIGMSMSIEDTVNLLDAFTQRLLTKICRGIDQDLMSRPLKQRTAAGSVVARLRR